MAEKMVEKMAASSVAVLVRLMAAPSEREMVAWRAGKRVA